MTPLRRLAVPCWLYMARLTFSSIMPESVVETELRNATCKLIRRLWISIILDRLP